jgi:hypothetical protein
MYPIRGNAQKYAIARILGGKYDWKSPKKRIDININLELLANQTLQMTNAWTQLHRPNHGHFSFK